MGLVQAAVSKKIAGRAATVANGTVQTSHAVTPSDLQRHAAPSMTVPRTPWMFVRSLVTQAYGTYLVKSPWKPAQPILVGAKGAVCIASIILLVYLFYIACAGLPRKKPCVINPEENHVPWPVCFYLVAYVFLMLMITDQFLPSLPTMLVDFDTDEQTMSFSIQGNWMIKAFTNLVTGVASDRIGRTRILLGGNALMIVATFGCCCATDIKWFLLCRMLQGLGESADVVIMATVRDYLPDDEKRAALMGILIAVTPIGPAIAPVFGGFMADAFGWRFSFFILACGLVLTFVVGIFCLKESSPDRPSPITVSEDVRNILLDRHLMILVICPALLSAGIMVVVSNIPYVIEDVYGKDILVSSWALAGLAVAATVGAISASALMSDSCLKSCRIALTILGISSVLMAAVAFSLTEHFESIIFFFLEAAVLVSPYIFMNTLVYSKAEGFAGMLAAFEGFAANMCMALSSMLGTKMTVSAGTKGLMLLQAGLALGCSIIFWVGFGYNPPAWALKLEDAKEQTSAKEAYGEAKEATKA